MKLAAILTTVLLSSFFGWAKPLTAEGFRADFPGTATIAPSQDQSPLGPAKVYQRGQLGSPDHRCHFVAVFKNRPTAEAILKAVQKEEPGFKVLERRSEHRAGRSALVLEGLSSEGIPCALLAVQGKRASYLVMAADYSAKEVEAFLASFRLLD